MSAHQHEHVHASEHVQAPEHFGGPQAGAVLDIGGEVGALLVNAPAALAGTEIQLYAEDGSVITHTDVHPRDVAGRVVHAGLFPSVPAGRYLVDAGRAAPVPLVVTGGEVTVIDESAAAPPPP